MVQEAMIIVFMLCVALQFSASTVIDILQCFKKGNRRYSLVLLLLLLGEGNVGAGQGWALGWCASA
eukprot:69032-Pelagomonas_calceolata.AAC.1